MFTVIETLKKKVGLEPRVVEISDASIQRINDAAREGSKGHLSSREGRRQVDEIVARSVKIKNLSSRNSLKTDA